MLTDGVVCLRLWVPDDAEWYAEVAAGDELIQRFTSEPPSTTAEQVRAAIAALARTAGAAGFVICDAATGERLGNMAADHEHMIGHVSYWLAAPARGRGAASRALGMFTRWILETWPVDELRHADNIASQAVAERAGFERDPDHDGPREVKGGRWPTIAYRLRRTAERPPSAERDCVGDVRRRSSTR